MNKEDEKKIEEVIEALPLWRNTFIKKASLIKALEEAFPEKKEETFDQSIERMDKEVKDVAGDLI